MSASLYMHKHGLDFAPQRLRKRCKVRWVDVIRPAHGYPFLAHSIQQAMAIYQWMVRSAEGYSGIFETLSCKGSCINFVEPDPFTAAWRTEIRERLHAAILDPIVSEQVDDWRRDMQIGVGLERLLNIEYYTGGGSDGSDDAIERRLNALFGVVGRTLVTSPNSYHEQARTIVDVELHVRPRAYALVLSYGYLEDLRGGSSWTLLIESGGRFADFMTEAEQQLRSLLVPDTTTQMVHGCFAGRRCSWLGDRCIDGGDE